MFKVIDKIGARPATDKGASGTAEENDRVLLHTGAGSVCQVRQAVELEKHFQTEVI